MTEYLRSSWLTLPAASGLRPEDSDRRRPEGRRIPAGAPDYSSDRQRVHGLLCVRASAATVVPSRRRIQTNVSSRKFRLRVRWSAACRACPLLHGRAQPRVTGQLFSTTAVKKRDRVDAPVSSFTSCMRSPLSRPPSSGCLGAGPAGTMAVATPGRHPSGAGPDDIFSPAARPMRVVLVARMALDRRSAPRLALLFLGAILARE